MPPVRALPMLSMTTINASPINRTASPNKASSTASPKKGHTRARSSSGSSNHSTGSGGSRAIAPFPTLIATSESVLEQNASDILWKTFVAFEQDCRNASNLIPLLPSIEQTVSAAIDPISLAAECLEETANYIEGDIRDAIEEALIGAGSANNSPDSPRSQLSSPISHSKQFSLASSRLSSVCSTFRATQANLRYYGGARKTAYQLDVFVHKYALPTSTALHKRGQEISAALKWLKKMLNSDGRTLDILEMSALRRASSSLTYWAEGLKIHSEILRSAATAVKALMTERASLQAYAFPPKAGSSIPSGLATSPISSYTNLPFLPSPTGIQSNFFDFPFVSPPAGQSSGFPPAAQQTHAPMMMSLPNGLPTNPPMSASALPQSCAFNFVSSPSGTQASGALGQPFNQDSVNSYFGSSLPQQTFSFGGMHTPDLSMPNDLFFDNLCM